MPTNSLVAALEVYADNNLDATAYEWYPCAEDRLAEVGMTTAKCG